MGVTDGLKKGDKVFGAHRSHGHLLALNPDAKKLFSEILGKETGFCGGNGGSMHLWDGKFGFMVQFQLLPNSPSCCRSCICFKN